MKVLGITDERTTCECCGRTSLKHTVALQMEDGRVVYYGSTCATKSFHGIRADLKTAEARFERSTKVKAYVAKWLAEGYAPEKIAAGARMHHGDVQYRDERFFLDGRILVYLPRWR